MSELNVAGKRKILRVWLIEALRANNGRASIVDVGEYIWNHHEGELRMYGELFYTWQYDVRWAATQLRKEGIMRAADLSPLGIWELI